MQTLQIKRNYFSFILSFITISFNWILYVILKDKDKIANNEYRKKVSFENNEKLQIDYYLDYHFAIKTLNIVYTLSFGLFAFIAIVYVISRIKFSIKRNILLITYLGLLICLSIPNGEPELYSNELNFNGFLKLFLAIPFVYFIYQDLIIGKQIDLSPQLNNKISSQYSSTKSELESLKNANLISNEDYDEKMLVLKYRSEKEKFLLSNEYMSLKNLKNSGIFTDEEFENKIEEIIKSKLKD